MSLGDSLDQDPSVLLFLILLPFTYSISQKLMRLFSSLAINYVNEAYSLVGELKLYGSLDL